MSTWADRDDEYTDAINEAHPTNTNRHDVYEKAMRLVGNRHSKYALINLVNYLLVKAEKS